MGACLLIAMSCPLCCEWLRKPRVAYYIGVHNRRDALTHFNSPTCGLSSRLNSMEAIQDLILKTLDEEGSIKDTRKLVLPSESSPAISQDAQLSILGALNSLASRDVSILPSMSFQAPFDKNIVDDNVQHARNLISCLDTRRRSDRA